MGGWAHWFLFTLVGGHTGMPTHLGTYLHGHIGHIGQWAHLSVGTSVRVHIGPWAHMSVNTVVRGHIGP